MAENDKRTQIFNAEIADDEAEKLSTIGEVVDYIDQHTAD